MRRNSASPLEKVKRAGVQPSVMNRGQAMLMGLPHGNFEATQKIVFGEFGLLHEALRVVEENT